MTKTLIILLAGVAIGLMIAPDKGTETRRKLSQLFDNDDDNHFGSRNAYATNETFPSGAENRAAREEERF
jgi:hypothetical protein